MAKRFMAVFLALVMVATLPAFQTEASAAAGTTETVDIETKDTGLETIQCKVYLPAGYDENSPTKYKVIYMLHGSGGTLNSWNKFFPVLDEMIENGDIEPVIAVAPVARTVGEYKGNYWVDSERFGGIETAVTRDVISYMDKEYNTEKNRSGRILAGFSMGGSGALRYSLVHPDKFSGAILMSPSLWDALPPITSRAWTDGAFGKTGSPDEFDATKWTAKNWPAALSEYVKQSERVKFYIMCGDDDWNHLSEKEDLGDDAADAYKYNMEEQALNLYEALHRENLFDDEVDIYEEFETNPAELRIVDGGHDDKIWLEGFRNGLTHLLKNTEDGEMSPKYDINDYPCPTDKKGTVTLVSDFTSEALKNQPLQFKVYLPNGYEKDAGKQYPVLYLLHGSHGNENSWNKFYPILDNMINEGKISPVIAVAPVTGNSYWVDSELGAYESAVIDDLITYIDNNYDTIEDRSGRALAGFSMGGYGATRYVLTYPDMFAGAVLLSPFVQDGLPPATSRAFTGGAFDTPFDEDLWKDLNYPAAIQSYVQQSNKVAMYIISGDDDWNHLLEKNDLPSDANKYNSEVQSLRLYRNLHRKNIYNLNFSKWDDVPASPAELRIVNGEHDENIWGKGFYDGLLYLFKNGLSGVRDIPEGQGFSLLNGTLSRDGGIKASVTVKEEAGHSGKETVIFQLLKGSTPVSITAVEKNFTGSESLTAHFNVTGPDYKVKVFVVDSYSNDINNVGVSLAEPLLID